MAPKYEIIEGDHSKFVGSYTDLDVADLECARLNREFNRDYFVIRRNDDGTTSYRNPTARIASERRAVHRLKEAEEQELVRRVAAVKGRRGRKQQYGG
jgi:hypothetical protein